MVPERAIEHAQTHFEITFEAQYPRITRIIGRIVHDPARAEELAVDIFCKLWRKSENAGDNINAWLSRSAVRAGAR
jgi:DNA-directed RNA polymerase specialized sigma24 family protein